MKKKTIGFICAAVAVVLCLLAYFRPLSLLDVAEDAGELRMVLSGFRIENGEPSIDTTEYQSITPEKKEEILTLLKEYPYTRTLRTVFSNGTIDAGDRMLSVYADDDVILIAASGQIAVNERSYRMQKADQLIGEILAVVGQAD